MTTILQLHVQGHAYAQPRYAQGWSPQGRRQAWVPRVVDPLTRQSVEHPIVEWRRRLVLAVLPEIRLPEGHKRPRRGDRLSPAQRAAWDQLARRKATKATESGF